MTTKTQDSTKKEELQNALVRTQHSVRRLHEILKLDTGIDLEAFSKVLNSKLIAQLDPNYPLMVAITGGGCSGKSSLFNALVGKNLSAVNARAGFTRRVLAAIHPDVLARNDFLPSLFEAFGVVPEPLSEIAELTTPGTPKYVSCDKVPPSLILLDTPDFDTGNCKEFANRSAAKPVLEACDVFLYIFTNANYNNSANTVFIRDALTRVGSRKALLVYRCSRKYSEEVVREHSCEVATNLYGSDFKTWLTGTYRINEDDDVVDGSAVMRVDPLNGEKPIREVLASLDCAQTRADFRRTALFEVTDDARKTATAATIARMELELYGYAVGVATSLAATEALKSFPQKELMQQFVKVWEQSQPRGLKITKRIGHVVASPITGLSWITKKVRGHFWEEASTLTDVSPEQVFQKNLFVAATDLRNNLLGQELAVKTTKRDPIGEKMIRLVGEIRSIRAISKLPVSETLGRDRELNIRVARPVSIAEVKEQGRKRDWQEELEEIRKEAAGVADVSEEINQQLQEIADRFRKDMGIWSRLRETFTASLSVLSAASAVTYVFFTGDPVGSAGIYAKLGALFGLNDLWALVTIPAATGLNKVDRLNLEKMLSEIFAAWFDEKVNTLRDILEKHINGSQIVLIEKILAETEKPLTELTQAVATLAEEKTYE